MPESALAIDIGGTRTRTAVIAGDGRMLARSSLLTRPRQGMADGLSRIAAAARQTMAMMPQVAAGIGIATPGLADPRRGIAFALANLPGWTNVPLKEYFEQAFNLPVFVGNDANLAALGEHRFGAGRGSTDMIYMTISTGIGAGIISDGRLLVGADGFAGEVGHMTVDANGPRCNCGNVGCLEMLASGTALARSARAALAAGAASSLLDLAGGAPEAISAETIARAAAAGDRLALELVEQAGVYIGAGMVNLIHLFNPQLFVLGGGVMNIGEPLLAAIRRTVDERAIAEARRNVRIVAAALGDDAGLMGAGALALGQDSGR